MAADTDNFNVWLCERLKSLNLDEEVLGEYISGILDSDDSNEEEKVEAMKDILEGMMDTPDDKVCTQIFMKWKECNEENIKQKKVLETPMHETLADVIQKQANTIKAGNDKLKIDADIKKHVIAHYGQESDEEIHSDSEDEFDHGSKPQGLEKGLCQNTNASSVAEKEKEKREKQKLENEEKKLKIKQDREKQKERVEQRKDKEKKRTQKGERRR